MNELAALARRRTRTSAVFVDFDNVFLGLNSIDPESARKFAENPGDWMAKFVDGEDEDGAYRRRFLVRACYLNPAKFSAYRAYFTRAGFKVVDCPSLTQQGKSGTDIHLVLDAIDALGASTRYDEFVIMSADADFTPLAVRCRADDRRVTVVTAGFSASAYRAVADTVIGGEQLIDLVNSDDELVDDAPATTAVAAPSTEDSDDDSTSHVVAAIREKVATATSPLPLATAAHVAGQSAPSLLASEWGGMGFAKWLKTHAPDLDMSTVANPGFVWDPSRHGITDLPATLTRKMDPLQEQIVRVTDIPAISQEEYRVLLEQLHSDVSLELFHRTNTSKSVRDACDSIGSPISRRVINFVISSLLYSHFDFDSDDISLEAIVEPWVSNAIALCQGARMDLSASDVTAIRTWLSGGLLLEQEPNEIILVGA